MASPPGSGGMNMWGRKNTDQYNRV